MLHGFEVPLGATDCLWRLGDADHGSDTTGRLASSNESYVFVVAGSPHARLALRACTLSMVARSVSDAMPNHAGQAYCMDDETHAR